MTMPRSTIETAATTLARARGDAITLDELPETMRPTTLDDAYAIQTCLETVLPGLGYGAPVGAKIGCTTHVMQEYLKVPHPCAGVMYAATLRHVEGTFRRSDLCRPGVECEIAVTLARDMDAATAYSAAAAAEHVAEVLASIELVDDRWTDFAEVSTPSLVADNFFNAGCVLGVPRRLDPSTLDSLHGCIRLNGEEIGAGFGRDILGHPMAALAWLATHRAQRGHPLRRGEIVTLGSLVKTAWIDAGDRVEIEIDGLGTAALHLV